MKSSALASLPVISVDPVVMCAYECRGTSLASVSRTPAGVLPPGEGSLPFASAIDVLFAGPTVREEPSRVGIVNRTRLFAFGSKRDAEDCAVAC